MMSGSPVAYCGGASINVASNDRDASTLRRGHRVYGVWPETGRSGAPRSRQRACHSIPIAFVSSCVIEYARCVRSERRE
jgi:hypothetical protein